jgi:hypothetical protein
MFRQVEDYLDHPYGPATLREHLKCRMHVCERPPLVNKSPIRFHGDGNR